MNIICQKSTITFKKHVSVFHLCDPTKYHFADFSISMEMLPNLPIGNPSVHRISVNNFESALKRKQSLKVITGRTPCCVVKPQTKLRELKLGFGF